MSLATLPMVQKLQTTLHAKAKGEPTYRFYTVYDKIFRMDVLDGLATLSSQRRGVRHRQPELRRDRGVRRHEVVGRTGRSRTYRVVNYHAQNAGPPVVVPEAQGAWAGDRTLSLEIRL